MATRGSCERLLAGLVDRRAGGAGRRREPVPADVRSPGCGGAGWLGRWFGLVARSRRLGFGFGTKKYCQPNSTTIDSTMARMKLRLFSSMGFQL